MNIYHKNENLLPLEGEVNYFSPVMSKDDEAYLFEKLFSTIEWVNDKAIIFGKLIITKRKVAWYGDKPFQYTYSKTTKLALPWTDELLQLKSLVESLSGTTYNSCLLNLYHHGEEGMAWHSDGEKDLLKNGTIASLSLGAERKFCFKHNKTKEKVCIQLQKGSLLLMKGATQSHWQHRLPPTKKVKLPRINLTFRTIVNQLT